MPPNKVCINKLKKEMKEYLKAPPPFIPSIYVNERNILEWHFLIQGPPDSPYQGGFYIGKIRFPVDYPFKPPSLLMVTPNGRFETGQRLCLSMSDFHPETWQPSWNVASILTGLLSFMLEDTMTTGSITTTDEEKQELAQQSLGWNVRNKQLAAMFPDHLRAADGGANGAAGTSQSTSAAAGQNQGDPGPSQATAQPLSAKDAALCRATAKDLEDGDPEGAKQRLEKYFKKLSVKGGQPAPELQLMMATATASAGDLDTAAELAQRASSGAAPSRLAGADGDGAGLAAGAEETFRAAAQAKVAGNAAYRSGDYADARDAYQQCVEHEPRCSAAHCNLAAAHAQLGRHDLAIASAQEALRLNRRYAKARQRLEDSQRALAQQQQGQQ